jgi:hypothetical protein
VVKILAQIAQARGENSAASILPATLALFERIVGSSDRLNRADLQK